MCSHFPVKKKVLESANERVSKQLRKALSLGVPKPGCFKPGHLQFLRASALLRSFGALLRTCVWRKSP